MESQVIFENPNLVLTHYPDESCILETWKGFTNFKVFSELLDKVMKFMIEKNATNLILDTREHKGLGPEGQQHGVKVCTEHARQYGQMKHAIIVPVDVFSKFSVDNFSRKLDKSELVVNKYFKDIDEALAWMHEKDLEMH